MEMGESPGWISTLFQASQLLYLAVAWVVGVRLLRLASKTGGAPERWLGWQFVIGSGIAYPVVIGGLLAVRPDQATPAYVVWMIALGRLGLDAALVFMLLFVATVFRADEAWARRAVWGGAGYTAAAYIALGFSGEFSRPTFNGLWHWLHYAPPVLVSGWVTFEAFRYYGILRRRLKLGLTDPVVTNRFLIWGGASVCGLFIVALGATPPLYAGADAATVRTISNLVLTGMSLFGVVAVSLYWLTFFPTQGYLRWIERSVPAAT